MSPAKVHAVFSTLRGVKLRLSFGVSAIGIFKPGDIVADDFTLDSCNSCPGGNDHLEQYCYHGVIFTYNGRDTYDQSITYGGCSAQILVDRKCVQNVLKEFKGKDCPGAAPLLCAGSLPALPGGIGRLEREALRG